MTPLTVSAEYRALLRKVPPKIIRSEKENEAYSEILYELDQKGRALSAAEKGLAALLTLLIEDFEERNYSLPHAKPVDALLFLMDQHGLMQKDLAGVFGTHSVVSEVLSGRREMSKEHIRRLSKRFRVSPELFF